MDKLIDMHIHTCFSDGDKTPQEIAKMAKENNLKAFAITDHDTVLGCRELTGYNDKEVQYIPGIELSAFVPKGRMHILGYNIDIYNPELQKVIDNKKRNSFNSLLIMYDYMKDKYSISIPDFEFDELHKKIGDVGRPDLAKLLVKYGYASNVEEAFNRYLIEAFDKTRELRKTTTKEECISAIKSAGGYISLAHPITLKLEYEELKKELLYLKNLGLDAIEISHSNQNEEYRKMLLILRDELKLLESGGSDYHGITVKPDIILGQGRNNIKIKELSLLNKINS